MLDPLENLGYQLITMFDFVLSSCKSGSDERLVCLIAS